LSCPFSPNLERALIEFSFVHLFVLGIIFLASTIRATLGFGDAVLAVPILTMLLPPTQVGPLMALCSLSVAIWMTWRDWREIRFASTLPLLLAVCLGVPFGVYFLKSADGDVVKAGLAIIIIGFALFRVFGRGQLRKTSRLLTFLVGFVSGVLCGAFNILGVVLAVYGAMVGWEVKQLRMTLQGVMLPAGLMLVANHGVVGHLTTQVMMLFLYALPLVCVASVLGQMLAHRVNPKRFEPVLTGMLFLIGVVLLATAL
jgi:uncharacterized membrane protein YfcA